MMDEGGIVAICFAEDAAEMRVWELSREHTPKKIPVNPALASEKFLP